jgi:tetratricopeptide (TPR) repeat protein
VRSTDRFGGSVGVVNSRACLTCGRLLPENSEECPVCELRTALMIDDLGTGPAKIRFGHYEIVTGDDGRLFELGRGAMGITYKALDVDLHCHVTLKVISGPYAKDESARIRFLREARAAAAVRNPNVASVFHLGKTDDDYFYAMEFVSGETVEQILREEGCFDTGTALEIVAQTANGLRAIQQENLIHRDLKPSNIMVSRKEGKIESVKIIDLGLAKPLDEPGTGISMPGSFAGTPDYASPEQFSGVQLDIRSDLYSLGITLWQMLSGDLPFKGSCSELVYQHQHVALPVGKLTQVPQPVIALLEVLLEKDPSERLQTPAELINGIGVASEALRAGKRVSKGELRLAVDEAGGSGRTSQRGRPIRVLVTPPRSLVWVRIGGWVAVLMLAAGLVLWITLRLNEQSRQLADVRREMGLIVTHFPQEEAEQRQSRAKEPPDAARKRAIEELAKQFGLDPKVVEQKLPQFAEQLKRAPDATTYERASAAYVAKDYNEAERLALAAADEAQRASPPKNTDAINGFELAGLAAEQRIEYADALDRLHEAEKLTDRAHDPLEWARVQFAFSMLLQLQRKDREAEPILREVLKERERALGPKNRDTLWTRTGLARTLAGQGKYADAEAEDRAVLDLQEKTLGPEDPDTLKTRDDLATALLDQGKLVDAEAEYRAVLKLREKVLGPEHPDTLKTQNNFACALAVQGKYAEAAAEYSVALKLQEKVLGPEDPMTLKVRTNLAAVLFDQGKRAEAEAEYRVVIKLQEKVLGPEHPDTLETRSNLADALFQQGKYAEAESEDRLVLKLREKVLGPEHPETLDTRGNLADALFQQGKYAEAESEDHVVLKLEEKVLSPEHPYTLITRRKLALMLDEKGKSAEAEEEDRAVLVLQEKVAGVENEDTLQTRNDLATALDHQGKGGEAETEYRAVLQLREKVLGSEHPDTLQTCFNLAQCLRAESARTPGTDSPAKNQEATGLAQRAADGARQVLGAEHPLTKKYEELLQELQAGTGEGGK